jgi:hypothetical protein
MKEAGTPVPELSSSELGAATRGDRSLGGKMRVLLGLVVFLAVVLLFVGGVWYTFSTMTYTGFYYPDVNPLLPLKVNPVVSPEFESIEQCRGWIDEQKEKFSISDGTYQEFECNWNCDFHNTIRGPRFECGSSAFEGSTRRSSESE